MKTTSRRILFDPTVFNLHAVHRSVQKARSLGINIQIITSKF